jgi:hypothetical protein
VGTTGHEQRLLRIEIEPGLNVSGRIPGNAGFALDARTGATPVWVEPLICETVVAALVDAKFLCAYPDGTEP